MMGRGYGGELIQENDATFGNIDVLSFLAGVTRADLVPPCRQRPGGQHHRHRRFGADPELIQNSYLGSQYHVEQFKTSDGKKLLDAKVQELVNAMAAFAPPANGQFTLPATYQPTLLPVIGADWGP